MYHRMILAGGAACVFANLVSAQVLEDGDAGDYFTGWQDTAGVGPLTTITGATDALSDDNVDAYCIRITNVSSFYATTDSGVDPLADAGDPFPWDTRLLLFDMAGNLVLGNDDGPQGGGPQSFISDPSTFPGGLVNSPGTLVAGQMYILAITGATNELFDGDGTRVANFNADFGGLHGPNPAAGPAVGWENAGFIDNGFYTIALQGATYCVPSPGALATFAMMYAATRRRRRV